MRTAQKRSRLTRGTSTRNYYIGAGHSAKWGQKTLGSLGCRLGRVVRGGDNPGGGLPGMSERIVAEQVLPLQLGPTKQGVARDALLTNCSSEAADGRRFALRPYFRRRRLCDEAVAHYYLRSVEVVKAKAQPARGRIEGIRWVVASATPIQSIARPPHPGRRCFAKLQRFHNPPGRYCPTVGRKTSSIPPTAQPARA